MWNAEAAWRRELAATSIGDLLAELETSVDPEQTYKALVWFIDQLSPQPGEPK